MKLQLSRKNTDLVGVRFTRLKTVLGCLLLIPAYAQSLDLDKLKVAPGFSVEIYASGVKNARQMALGDNGTVFVGSRGAGLVHAVIDDDKDGKADRVLKIAEGMNMPSGLAFNEGHLYVSEVSKVTQFANIEQHLQGGAIKTVVVQGLPSDKHHGWKNIDFGPDGKLYIPVGAPCNICETNGGEKFNNPDYASILRYDLSSGEKSWVAKGVRNSVGFDWHPQTKELWFSDNGRDWMGDDIPPCEINRVSTAGQHFGYPYFHGGDIADPEFGKNKKADDYAYPALNLGAHVAPLGIHFYQGDMFPKQYKQTLLVAEHGSWNRSKKVGYRVMAATVLENKVVEYKEFISGWLNPDETVWGRPVAMLALPDGSLLLSDDFADTIYRISYQK